MGKLKKFRGSKELFGGSGEKSQTVMNTSHKPISFFLINWGRKLLHEAHAKS